MKDPYIKLAKDTVKSFLKTKEVISPPDNLPKKMLAERAGVFVSIHKKEKGLPRGREAPLRGCIGTFLPTQKNIAQEIIRNALAAAFNDPRFPPVTEKELKDLTFSVDILSQPKPVPSPKHLDPEKCGLIIFAFDGRRSLLLPDIPGVETAEQQIEICRQKAGIGPKEEIELQTFTVERHGKP